MLPFERFVDKRGYFQTAQSTECLKISPAIIRQSFSLSHKGVRRGMHMQKGQWQTITVVSGLMLEVLLDCRPNSATFGEVEAFEFSADDAMQIILPPGIAHGYEVPSDEVIIHYGSTVEYFPKQEVTINTESAILSKVWKIPDPIMSNRDKEALDWSIIKEKKDFNL
jgi:dTDP-4-dehydrorhamnose 3,5-epimerase